MTINGIPKKAVTKFMETPKHREGDCVIWDGKRRGRPYEYGRVTAFSTDFYAHRIAFALSRGAPAKNFVLHICDVPLCVNPSHLYDGTSADNARDRSDRGRDGQGKRYTELIMNQ